MRLERQDLFNVGVAICKIRITKVAIVARVEVGDEKICWTHNRTCYFLTVTSSSWLMPESELSSFDDPSFWSSSVGSSLMVDVVEWWCCIPIPLDVILWVVI